VDPTSQSHETAMLTAVAAAAAAVNKNSPQLFSKYIESVHKAMHGSQQQEESTVGQIRSNSEHSKFVEHCRQLFDDPAVKPAG